MERIYIFSLQYQDITIQQILKAKRVAQAVLLLAAFVGWTSAQAQKQELRYVNERYKEVAKEEARFFERIDIRADGTAEISRYTIDSTLVNVTNYKDFEKNREWVWVRSGPYKVWHPNGQLASEGNYINNKQEGASTSWFENSQIKYSSFHRNGMLEDTLKGYYENGALRRLEVYATGKMLKGEVFAPDGTPQAFYPSQELPQFPGGEAVMLSYLSSNIKFPKSARKAKVNGLVVISFVVEKDGSINRLEVVKPLQADADAEALRVVNSMPRWQPGKQEGEVVPVSYVLPIRFSFR